MAVNSEADKPAFDQRAVHRSGSHPGEQRADVDERRAMVALSMVQGLGPRRIQKLMRQMGSAREVMAASERALSSIPGIGSQCAARIAEFDAADEVDRQVELAARCGAYLVTEGDPRYPPLLRQIYLPPPCLWVRGELPLQAPFVAVVGTRRPSDYGLHVTQALVAELVHAGVVIVSGLAYGIDREAHSAALTSGGQTIAVLGSGVDRVYPSAHAALARSIERSGAMVSEFPLGTKPDATNFPQRNRVISGMCCGTVVVEAFEKGGALITASFANEQNREVFAVPGRLGAPSSVGTNQLIRDGLAKLVTNADDILVEITAAVSNMPSAGTERQRNLRPDELAIVNAIGGDVLQLDSIGQRTRLPASNLLSALLRLELSGVLRQYPGKSYGLKA